MKQVLLACASALALTGAAAAADLSRRPPPPVTKAPPALPAAYNWTGFYFGVNAGGAFGTSRWDSTDEFDLSGALVGGTVGYNWQNGPWVFGLEGDVDWTNIKGDTTTNCPLGCETKNSWLATARGRLGVAFDRVLPYATGGLAVGDIKARTPGLPGADETNTGWTAGGGVELGLAGNWTAKAEYLYVDLGKFDCGAACGGGGGTDNVTFKSHLVRGGLNLRF
jgi:outer membrane immunogenic protein